MAASDILKTTYEGKVIPVMGTPIISDTNTHTLARSEGYIVSLIPREDTVVATATGFDETGTATDFRNTMNWGTLKAADGFLTLKDNCYITVFKLTSGSVVTGRI